MILRAVLLALLAFAAAADALAQPAARKGAFRHEPMAFFVAKGGADACGPGCDTWIAAEGTFDPEAPLRLAAFLTAERQRLPIFFHSPGGELQPSLSVGRLLRERRMTAGIGQTIPEGCRDGSKANAACRKLMQSGRALPSRLRTGTGLCASGCAYALIGASTRRIAPDAKFGLHANRVMPRPELAGAERREIAAARVSAESQSYDLLRHYVTLAGVEPALIDLAIKTPHNRVHWLTREELTRFGVTSRDYFETRWFRLARPNGSVLIVKSVTQASRPDAQDHRTVSIGIDCAAGHRPSITLRRELSTDDMRAASDVTLSSGEAFLLVFKDGRRQDDAVETRMQPVAADALARAAGSDRLMFREDNGSWSRERRLSTDGLPEALRAAPLRCGGRV